MILTGKIMVFTFFFFHFTWSLTDLPQSIVSVMLSLMMVNVHEHTGSRVKVPHMKLIPGAACML